MPVIHKYLVSLSLIVVGVIHLLPLSGAIGVEQLNALYGIGITDPDLAILMRHRAVLFGLLGLFCVYAAVRPPLQLIALTAGAVSVGAFLYLAWATGGYNVALKRVFVVDLVAAVFLAVGFFGCFVRRSGKGA